MLWGLMLASLMCYLKLIRRYEHKFPPVAYDTEWCSAEGQGTRSIWQTAMSWITTNILDRLNAEGSKA